jgi:PhnB protein
MATATPFLLFDGDCAEAMAFYHRCLGGELTVTRLGDTAMKESLPADKHDRVVTAHLRSGDLAISAADWMASPEFDPVQGNTFAVLVSSESGEELTAIFDRLRDGSHNTRLQELHEMPFGLYGQFYDRYGVQWIFRSGDGSQGES